MIETSTIKTQIRYLCGVCGIRPYHIAISAEAARFLIFVIGVLHVYRCVKTVLIFVVFSAGSSVYDGNS